MKPKFLFTILCASMLHMHPASGQAAQKGMLAGESFYSATYLTELRQGSNLSDKIQTYRSGGFETSRGDWVSFSEWYRSNWTDMRAGWMTQMSPHWGILWGINTGESAQKYTIRPGLKIGMVLQLSPANNSLISVNASARWGGELQEKTCIADYGMIGGVMEVNCRLAASPLAPSETLKYVHRETPDDKFLIMFRYSLNFW